MPAFQYCTADVFTNERFGGNQLAVFPNAEGISADEIIRRVMQHIPAPEKPLETHVNVKEPAAR